MLLIKIHSKHTFKLFYTSTSYTNKVTNKQLGPKPIEKSKKKSIILQALTTTLFTQIILLLFNL